MEITASHPLALPVGATLDMLANIRCSRALKNGGEACAIISEEDEDIIYTLNNNGKYVVAIDSLDGSSGINVNVSIGTIFSELVSLLD